MPKPRRRKRKQRVVIRARRREKMVAQTRGLFVKTTIFAVAGGVAFLLVTQGDSLFGGFVQRHTPSVEMKTPQTLALSPEPPALTTRTFRLWFPWNTAPIAREMMRANSAVQEVRFDKNFLRNQIYVRVVPRTPVVQNGTQGMDVEGVLFPLLPGSWNALPRVTLNGFIPPADLGKWIAAMQKQSLWKDVVAVSDDRMGDVSIDLQTGAHILWGKPEILSVREKTTYLAQALEDAHEHLGGAAQADLRFFDEGRIIVRPKGTKR
jgi:hypothetical protein